NQPSPPVLGTRREPSLTLLPGDAPRVNYREDAAPVRRRLFPAGLGCGFVGLGSTGQSRLLLCEGSEDRLAESHEALSVSRGVTDEIEERSLGSIFSGD